MSNLILDTVAETVDGSEHGLTVGCNGGSVRLADIRPEGKGRMRDVDFLRGNKVEKGAKLQ